MCENGVKMEGLYQIGGFFLGRMPIVAAFGLKRNGLRCIKSVAVENASVSGPWFGVVEFSWRQPGIQPTEVVRAARSRVSVMG